MKTITRIASRPTEAPEGCIVTLPDGYNGHTEIWYATPIDQIGDTVKLRCARSGKEYMIRWVRIRELEDAIREPGAE